MGTLTALAGQRTCLDTNILIYFVEAHAKYSPLLVDPFHAIDQGSPKAFTSELTLAECLVKPFIDNNLARQQTYQSMITPGANLQVIGVTRSILIAAAQLRALYRLSLADAIHLATALESTCETFITNDQLVRPIPGIKIIQLDGLVS